MVSRWLIFAGLLLIPAWIAYRISYVETPKISDLDLDEWWGPGNKTNEDTSVRRFKIDWSVEMIKDLKHRLATRRPLTPPLQGIAFEYGFNSQALEPILEYWQKEYDFNRRRDYLNKYSQYKTRIQGLDIHFIRVKPETKPDVKVLPLLILHGWPGSVREFYESIPLLTSQRLGNDFVFEVVVPSLVGFGYSDAAVRPGLGTTEQAIVMRNLMRRLGHKQYFVQGGDWGSIIGSNIATLFPQEVLGYHTNFPVAPSKAFYIKLLIGSVVPWMMPPALAAKVYPLTDYFSELVLESGYFRIQATKPDTVGVSITDSPAGLAAYILEKFSTGTKRSNRQEKDGGLSQFRTEDLLDNLMIYWDSNHITSSLRLYAESAKKRGKLFEIPTPVPTWAMHTPNELFFHPATLMRQKFTNLLDVSMTERGGHFAAFEIPKEFVEDVFRAVRAFQRFHLENTVNTLK